MKVLQLIQEYFLLGQDEINSFGLKNGDPQGQILKRFFFTMGRDAKELLSQEECGRERSAIRQPATKQEIEAFLSLRCFHASLMSLYCERNVWLWIYCRAYFKDDMENFLRKWLVSRVSLRYVSGGCIYIAGQCGSWSLF